MRISQSGRGSAAIGAAPPPEPGPHPPGPVFQEAHRDAVASATDDSSWLIPVAPGGPNGPAKSLCVVSGESQEELDAMSDDDVAEKAEVTVDLDGVLEDGTAIVTASIPNDLPAGEVTELYRAVIVYGDAA